VVGVREELAQAGCVRARRRSALKADFGVVEGADKRCGGASGGTFGKSAIKCLLSGRSELGGSDLCALEGGDGGGDAVQGVRGCLLERGLNVFSKQVELHLLLRQVLLELSAACLQLAVLH
jgi:hypothetical protein